jgi:hypothetical protein
MMFGQIIPLFFSLFFLPGFFILSLWKSSNRSRFEWLLRVVNAAAVVLFIFIIGPWDWFSYYLRYLLLVLLAAAALVSYHSAQGRPFFLNSLRDTLRSSFFGLLEAVVLLGLLIFVLTGHFYFEEPVELAFPLQDGFYYVGQGGNNVLVNYHNVSRAQKYALDIVALNAAGLRARGFYPAELERYVIYGAPLYCPCDGEVVAAVDGLPDQIPPAADSENAAGNHVAISCKGVIVLLAHLQPGSLLVQAGDTVTTGQPLGRVGNSGNTSEPHLHIHAIKGGAGDVLAGEGVPVIFDNRFPVRNSVFIR